MYIRTYVTVGRPSKAVMHIYIRMYIFEQQNRLRATHVAIIKNMKQDVSTWRSLSTAGYKVYLKLTKTSGLKRPASYIATCVAR